MSIHSKTYALGPVLNYLMVLTGLVMKTVSEFYLCPPDALTFTLTICLRPVLLPLLHTDLSPGNLTTIESSPSHVIQLSAKFITLNM